MTPKGQRSIHAWGLFWNNFQIFVDIKFLEFWAFCSIFNFAKNPSFLLIYNTKFSVFCIFLVDIMYNFEKTLKNITKQTSKIYLQYWWKIQKLLLVQIIGIYESRAHVFWVKKWRYPFFVCFWALLFIQGAFFYATLFSPSLFFESPCFFQGLLFMCPRPGATIFSATTLYLGAFV